MIVVNMFGNVVQIEMRDIAPHSITDRMVRSNDCSNCL